MRFFAELAYKGTNYSGYQVQPNAPSVQETLEGAFSTILNAPTAVVGCGRTDSGVHASQYFIHFEADSLPQAFTSRLNKFLPKDIAIRRIFPVAPDMHARFNATRRSYTYYVGYDKNPFNNQLAFYYHAAHKLDLGKLNEAAALLLEYEEFAPFCKSKSDAKTMFCRMTRSEWVKEGDRLIYHVSANRFLRGMVRLIVGACMLVGEGKITLADLKQAMEDQKQLQKSWSVPPQGLFLAKIRYPFMDEKG